MWIHCEIVKMVDEDKVHQFLMGLNDESYSIVPNQILALDLCLSHDIMFSMVQQEENHKRVMTFHNGKQEPATAFAVCNVTRQPPQQGERIGCKHYERF